MENRGNKDNTKITKLLINSIEDELESLLEKEFYDGRHTPQYAVKLVRDSIANNPTIESCLAKCQYINFGSKDVETESRLKPQHIYNAWQDDCVRKSFMPNRAHKYLSETELNADHKVTSLGKPTRATLLKERMHWSLNRPNNASNMSEQLHNRSACSSARQNKVISDEIRQRRSQDSDIDHGFLVGARYNSSHFLDLNSIRDKGLYVSKSNHGIVFVNNSMEQFNESELASPPNSPESMVNSSAQSPHYNCKDISDRLVLRGQTVSKFQNKTCQSNPIIKRIDNIRIAQIHHTSDTTTNANFHKGLPFVEGSKWIPPNTTGSISNTRPLSRASLSRSAINIHFAKQNRLLRNRYHNNLKNKRTDLEITPVISSPEFNDHTTNCVKCVQCA